MKKILSAFVILSCVLQLNVSGVNANQPDIDAQASILIDSKTGQVLFEQNSQQKGLYPASTTKIMTAIIALERGDMNQIMTASQAAINDIGKDGMHIGIMEGEQIPLINLLEAMLISSANETANIIAENICETREEFIELMNQKAKELGAVDTHFTNTCGMHDPQHFTTAADLAKIARHAMSIPEFRNIVSKTEYNMPVTNKHDSWPTLYSTNLLLRRGSQNAIYRINGIKTGYTNPAGFNLVSSAENDYGMELIGVVMGVRNDGAKNNVYKYSEQLLEYGFQNFSTQSIVNKGQVIKKDIQVIDAEDDAVLDLVAENSIECVMPLDVNKWDLVRNEHINSPITVPVNKGDILGYVEYVKDGIVLGKTNILASQSIKKSAALTPDNPDNSDGSLTNILGNPIFRRTVIIVCIVLIAFVILRMVLRKISRKLKYRNHKY
jgi:D-alanyl-D-alanine carboxypeptidase (penicillin-binding protein 5/6)